MYSAAVMSVGELLSTQYSALSSTGSKSELQAADFQFREHPIAIGFKYRKEASSTGSDR